VAAAFTLISGLQYLVQGMRFLNAAQDAERDGSAGDMEGPGRAPQAPHAARPGGAGPLRE
jgi:hypothetical protein